MVANIVSATGNVVAGSFFIGNGSQLSGVTSTTDANTLTGNTLKSTVINSSLTSVGTLGTLAVSSNVDGGNLRTSGQISSAGNVLGQNLNTGGVVSATGNVTGGNFNTGGLISAVGAISSGANISGSFFIGNGSQLTGVVANIVIDTPVYFSGSTFGNIVEGTRYYVKSIDTVDVTITISATYQGVEFTLADDTGEMGVTMWEQNNVDRVWVTVKADPLLAMVNMFRPGEQVKCQVSVEAREWNDRFFTDVTAWKIEKLIENVDNSF